MYWFDTLRGYGEQINLKAGEMLFVEKQPSKGLYFALSGAFGVYVEDCKVFDAEPGSFLGGETVVDRYPHSYSARAERDSSAILVSDSIAGMMLEQDREFLHQFMAGLCRNTQHLILSVRALRAQTRSAVTSPASLTQQVRAVQPPPKASPLPPAKQAGQTPYVLVKKTENKPPVKENPAPAASTASTAPATPSQSAAAAILPSDYTPYNIVQPESWKVCLSEKKCECPACSKTYSDQNVLNFKLKTKTVTADMRTICEDFEPLWFSVRVCPHCNIATLVNNFAKLNSRDGRLLAANNYDKNIAKFSGFGNPRTIDQVFESYYLALQSNAHTVKDIMIDAQIWRRLMWLYGDVNDTPKFEMARATTLEKYINVFSNRTLTGPEEEQINMILGQLHMQVGENSTAYKHFMNVIQASRQGGGTPVIVKAATDCIADIRAMGH